MTMTTMIAGALAVLLTHSGAEPTASFTPPVLSSLEADGGDGNEALIGRVFDLHGLTLAAPTEEFTDRTSTLLPLLSGMGDRQRTSGELNANWESIGDAPAYPIVEAFVEVFIDGNDAKLDSVEVLEDGLVYLVGSTEVLDQFAAFVERLGSSMTSHPTLEILQFRVGEGAVRSLPAGVRLGGQVERAQLMTWLSSGVDFTERRVDLSGTGVQIVSDLASHTVTAMVATQIAQSSGIFEPLTYEAAVGTDLTLSGYRSGDGVQLQYMAKSTERQDSADSRSYRLESRHYPEQGRESIDQTEAWSEAFGTAGGHSVGTASISSTHYLVLSIGASNGHVRCVAISVDPDSLGHPAVSQIDSPTSLAAVTIPGGLQQHSYLELQWTENTVETLEYQPDDALEGGEGLFRAYMSPRDSSLFRHMMELAEVQSEHRLSGTSLIVVNKEDAPRIEQWASLAPARETYHVSVKTHDALGRDHRRGSVSIQSGTAGALVSGYEQLLAKGTSVEVAQRFATREVTSTTHFEGLALGIELSKGPGGSLLYGLRGQMVTDLDVTESSANDSADAGLVAVSAAHLIIRETGTAAPTDAPGTWTIVVGDETQKGPYVELTISTQ